MRKMTAIINFFLIAAMLIFGTAAVTKLILESRYEDKEIAYKAKIDRQKKFIQKLEDEWGDLKYDLSKCLEELDDAESEILSLKNDNECLDNVIQRMRAVPEAEKLLKERIPYGMTNTIRFMDYTEINNTASWQYKLQQECKTDDKTGIRIYADKNGKGYYCTALGSAYGRDIGDTWHVTLACGTEFNIIYAEYKDDGSTDYFGHPDTNKDKQDCINILEFVVDVNEIPSAAMSEGTFTAWGAFGGLHGNGGNVAKMEYTGRVWEP